MIAAWGKKDLQFVINQLVCDQSIVFFHSLSFKCKSKVTGGTLECKSSREHLKNWKIPLSFKLDLSLDLAIWVKNPWKVIWATQNDHSSSPSQGIEWNSETGYFLVHRRKICSEDLQYHALYCWYVCKVESTRVWMLICTALIMILCGSTMCSIWKWRMLFIKPFLWVYSSPPNFPPSKKINIHCIWRASTKKDHIRFWKNNKNSRKHRYQKGFQSYLIKSI